MYLAAMICSEKPLYNAFFKPGVKLSMPSGNACFISLGVNSNPTRRDLISFIVYLIPIIFKRIKTGKANKFTVALVATLPINLTQILLRIDLNNEALPTTLILVNIFLTINPYLPIFSSGFIPNNLPLCPGAPIAA
ncbi:MAG: Uncharacterised protein [Methanobacteriota archaeon]|nr:MAG: Uncharacterised protein [Euryarchaeota archaeon]